KRKAWHRRCRRRGHIRWSRVRPRGIPTQRLLTRQASTTKRQRQTRRESVPSRFPPEALALPGVAGARLPGGFIWRFEGGAWGYCRVMGWTPRGFGGGRALGLGKTHGRGWGAPLLGLLEAVERAMTSQQVRAQPFTSGTNSPKGMRA